MFKRMQLMRLHQMRHKLGEVVAAEMTMVPLTLKGRNAYRRPFLLGIHLHGVCTSRLVTRVPVQVILVSIHKMAVQVISGVCVVVAVAPMALQDFCWRQVRLRDAQGGA